MTPGPYGLREHGALLYSEPIWRIGVLAFGSLITLALLWLLPNRSQREDLRPVIPRYSRNRDHADGHSFAINIFIPEHGMTAMPHEGLPVPN